MKLKKNWSTVKGGSVRHDSKCGKENNLKKLFSARYLIDKAFFYLLTENMETNKKSKNTKRLETVVEKYSNQSH